MNIPEQFKIAGFDIKVELVDKTDDNNFGNWNDVTNTITIAKSISLKNGELTNLTERQMQNTFFHELLHAFQFYCGKEYSEIECNVFANFMVEFLETKK